MEKAAWEQTLHDPAQLTKLAEWSRTAGLNASDLAGVASPESNGFSVEQPSHLEKLTPESITASNKSTEGAPLLHQIESFVPDLSGLTPLKALEAAQARFESDSSPSNGKLLQAAMNGITTGLAPDDHHTQALQRAGALFSAEDTKNSPPLTDDIWYKVYEHANFGGRSVFENMTPGFGYWRRPDFGAVGMNDMISSIGYGASGNEVGGSVILFEHARYFGGYRVYPVIPGRTGQVGYVGNDFNDIASSALIVRRFPKETTPVSLSNLVPKSAITDIVNATPKVSPAGDATFTWDMWPAGGSSSDYHPNDPQHTFIYINVPIHVKTPWPWPDYYAQVRFFILLYVDSAGKMQGYVAYWGYYVEGGAISGQVASGLRDAIPGTIPKVNGLITQALGLVNAGSPYTYLYYLPGRYQLAGNVSDDITIVAVRR